MTTETAPDTNGKPEPRHIRALAFAGGAFDTIMQMGVVHALLVSRGKAPDHVVGISAGAVNAAALAEILQEGKKLEGKERLVARVRRFRAILDRYLELPRTFVHSALPDAFEINAKKPLRPLELPIHLPEERNSRSDASRAKAGLIRLMNHLLGIRVTVAAATRMIRRILAFIQADELPRPARPRDTILLNAFFLWLLAARWALSLSELLFAMVNGILSGRHRSVMRGVESTAPKLAKRMGMPTFEKWLSKTVDPDAGTAAQAIQRRMISYFAAALRRALGLLLFVTLWSLPLLLLSPSQELVESFGTQPRIDKISQELTLSDAHKLLSAILALPSATNEALVVNIRKLWKQSVVVVRGSGTYLWSLVCHHRVTLLGLLIPYLIAILIEMLFRFQWAGMAFLFAWMVFIAAFDTVWPVRPFTERDHTRISLLIGVIAVVAAAYALRRVARRRLLEYYEINDALFSADVLRQHLVHCFDKKFYGYAPIESIIRAALRRGSDVGEVTDKHARKRVDYYDSDKVEPKIHVAPVAANIKNGHLEIVNDASIVEALLAATAIVPLFPAQDVGEPQKRRILDDLRRLARRKPRRDPDDRTWYIDGLNVSNEPMQPLFRYLREKYDRNPAKYADVETVDIYPVSDVPVDEPRLPQEGEYSTLVQVGLRALELKQFRDGSVERRLTRLYTRALPKDRAFHHVPSDPEGGNDEARTFVHADLYPIELEKPARVNRRWFRGANPDDLKRILRETVADGCRASLEAMLSKSIFTGDSILDLLEWVADLTNKAWPDEESQETLPAETATLLSKYKTFPENVIEAEASAIRRTRGFAMRVQVGKDAFVELIVDPDHFAWLKEILFPRCKDVVSSLLKEPLLPGSDPDKGPGLSEICRNCRLNRPKEGDPPQPDVFDQQRLRLMPSRANWPQWPPEHPDDRRPDVPARRGVRSRTRVNKAGKVRHKEIYDGWPQNPDRPVVSFLFGGGVFRGVFHMGVMNALNEAGLEPDLVAGSSVGSIVAAMIARAFKITDADQRHRRIGLLAATFLGIDQLVLTDRLADFTRRFTLRAAEAQFSPRDIDRALRNFDADGPRHFNRRVRKVMAGLERLFYFSPFELFDVLRDARLQNVSKLMTALTDDLQELLERGGLGEEILGSEPLSLLIERHVTDTDTDIVTDIDTDTTGAAPFTFRTFLDGPRKIFFLATATNLVEGRLQILGNPSSDAPGVLLENGLLASSAFPAVFRPRQSWEIFAETHRDNKYIDGGTIDNLPLDAVASFLARAAEATAIPKRHAVPHLLFTASLEVNPAVHANSQKELRRDARDCFALMRRAATFKYNRKIDAYASVQRRLRAIHAKFGKQQEWEPLNLHVLAVKPNWLCGTFGFHPMLGFRRVRQAQSIAHGCASTLAALFDGRRKNEEWFATWGARDLDFVPEALVVRKDEDECGAITLLPQKRDPKSGQCWFRDSSVREHLCPFSRKANTDLNDRVEEKARVSEEEVVELDKIYRECGQASTHKPH